MILKKDNKRIYLSFTPKITFNIFFLINIVLCTLIQHFMTGEVNLS